jgi:hypothetical protein
MSRPSFLCLATCRVLLLLLPPAGAAGDHPTGVHTTNIMRAGSKSGSGTSSLRTYKAFMCPGFVPIRGHLLAFAEGRIWTCADFGAHDLVMRRSVDDGKSWEPLRTLLDPNTLPGCNKTEACIPYTEACQWSTVKTGKVCGGGCAVWDPTPVVDNITGEVHVLFSRTKSSCLGSTQPVFPGMFLQNVNSCQVPTHTPYTCSLYNFQTCMCMQ